MNEMIAGLWGLVCFWRIASGKLDTCKRVDD